MTQRRRRHRARRGRFGRRAFLAGAGCAALAGAAVMLGRGQTASASSVMAPKSTPTYFLTASTMVSRGQPGVRSICSPCHST